MAPVLKTGKAQAFVGSNPTPSASFFLHWAWDATLTPSRNAAAMRERRRCGNNGPLIATNTNDGKKMPNIASNAAGVPPKT